MCILVPLIVLSIIGISESFAEQASGKPAWETNSDKICGDIPYKRFTVLQPDPHRFDGDKDGIGCES